MTTLAMLLVTTASYLHTESEWAYKRVDDPLHGKAFDQFTLTGNYLKRPEVGSQPTPAILERSKLLAIKS